MRELKSSLRLVEKQFFARPKKSNNANLCFSGTWLLFLPSLTPLQGDFIPVIFLPSDSGRKKLSAHFLAHAFIHIFVAAVCQYLYL